VLDCCLRQYCWTGDQAYLQNPALRFFYAKSVNEYVRQWDKDGDGLLEHYPEYGFRGIATYNEEVADPLVGADLIAAQYAGYRAFASFMELDERRQEADHFNEQAAALKGHYNQHWWDAQARRYYGFINQDRSFSNDEQGMASLMALYFDLVDGKDRVSQTLDLITALEPQTNVETRSYIPEILYRYGRIQAARAVLRSLFDPGLARREYPELSFALIGALATGLIGLAADARERLVTTLPRLTSKTGWAKMANIPLFETQIDVQHTANAATILKNHGPRPIYWRAVFPGDFETLLVNEKPFSAQHASGMDGQSESSVLLRVQGGESISVRVGG
jgi:hypothetical protein